MRFEEPEKNLRKHMNDFGWDAEEIHTERNGINIGIGLILAVPIKLLCFVNKKQECNGIDTLPDP